MTLPQRTWRHRLIATAIGACLVVHAITATAVSAATRSPRGTASYGAERHKTRFGPVIKHTEMGPTGYEVTFRYYDPHATRVQVRGDWYFESPFALPELAGTPGHPVKTPGLLPSQWQPGDVPIQSPNSTAGNWPVTDLKEISHSGVWTYTTPLPSGVFSYGFLVNCHTSDQSGCTEVPDPGNPTWATTQGVTDASSESQSTIYVPSDPRFGSVNDAWQAPAVKRGTLTHVTYPSPGHTSPANMNYLVVYTPPGYNPHRAKSYPTLYLSPGGGGSELGWSISGDVPNILDNLVGTGQIQPLVVVMLNAQGFADSPTDVAYRVDLIKYAIPWVQRHYNVSTSASKRAFSGLSFGGMLTNQLMLHNASEFGYYGMMSAGLPPGTTLTAAQIATLKKAIVFVGAGWQDVIFADGWTLGGTLIHTGPAKEVRTLANAKIPVTTDFVNGGHEWHVWRILLRDFLTRVAFWPSAAATW
jgi:enterochelin esterase-like enzyme